MPGERVLVIGLGEVEIPLFELLQETKLFHAYGLDTDEAKMRKLGQTRPPNRVDVMHVCIPCLARKTGQDHNRLRKTVLPQADYS